MALLSMVCHLKEKKKHFVNKLVKEIRELPKEGNGFAIFHAVINYGFNITAMSWGGSNRAGKFSILSS